MLSRNQPASHLSLLWLPPLPLLRGSPAFLSSAISCSADVARRTAAAGAQAVPTVPACRSTHRTVAMTGQSLITVGAWGGLLKGAELMECRGLSIGFAVRG